MEEKKFDKEEIRKLLNKRPELVPLSEDQKDGFLYLWNAYPKYKARQVIVGQIDDLYNNRLRYRALLTKKEDIEMFNAILRDDDTLF